MVTAGGGPAAGETIIGRMIVAVPPLKASIPAPYILKLVVVVTVGAVQLNVQLLVAPASPPVWVISPPDTLLPVPAVNVPPTAETSSPPLLADPPETVSV